jgi:hypothetical protein
MKIFFSSYMSIPEVAVPSGSRSVFLGGMLLVYGTKRGAVMSVYFSMFVFFDFDKYKIK